jgi:hypothetical protein
LRPGKNDPKLLVPSWFKGASANRDNTPRAVAATAPVPHAPKPGGMPCAEVQNSKLQSTMERTEPPESPEWNPADYDDPTAFPTDMAGIGEHAA